jgi:hypothetical protein
MNFFTILLINFISNALTGQLTLFRTALLCFIGIGASILCCKLISGHFTLDLEITAKRNRIIFILYSRLKISAPTVFNEKKNNII